MKECSMNECDQRAISGIVKTKIQFLDEGLLITE